MTKVSLIGSLILSYLHIFANSEIGSRFIYQSRENNGSISESSIGNIYWLGLELKLFKFIYLC